VAKPPSGEQLSACKLSATKLTHATVDGNIKPEWENSAVAGYIFVWWKGDHPPRHVHVYRNERLIVKWDLDNHKAMKGRASKRVIDLIEKLESEGLL